MRPPAYFFEASRGTLRNDEEFAENSPSERATAGARMRGPALRHIYAASDLHTDHAANMEWVRALASRGRYRNDVLICAGDVSDKLQVLEQTMALLSDAFGAVFFAPGNHEFWVGREDASDSLAKLAAVQRVLEAYGVLTTPQRVALASGRAVAIAPLLSFHHASFDTEPDVVGLDLPTERCLADYRRCAWPPPLPRARSARTFFGLGHVPAKTQYPRSAWSERAARR